MTVFEVQKSAVDALTALAGDETLSQVRSLLCCALNLDGDILELLKRLPTTMTDAEYEAFNRLFMRRMNGEPLQYILGEWDFFGLSFHVDKRALIPRQDTETLVECALNISREMFYKTALDVCCGSGCIGITLNVLGGLCVTMSDISSDALALANENCELHKAKITLIESDLFGKITDKYDLICINPPYLTAEDMSNLQTEVKSEPQIALFGGDDGLDFYRRIAKDYRKYLNPNGALLLEIGATQNEAVKEIFPAATIISDLCGKPRVAVIR